MMVEELKKEQDISVYLEWMKKILEQIVCEFQVCFEEVEQVVFCGGKKQVQKLEVKVWELEVEFDVEQKKYVEVFKGVCKYECCVKEFVYQVEEDRKNLVCMQDLVDKLQSKVKSYKCQFEEVEQQVNINLVKYCKVQYELDDVEEWVDMVEIQVNKLWVWIWDVLGFKYKE